MRRGPILLARKTAVITGAARGIGSATARRLAEPGAGLVVLANIDREHARTEARRISSETDCRAKAYQIALSKPAEIDELFRFIDDLGRTPEIPVNCAGVCPVRRLEDTDAAAWDTPHAINLRSVFLCCREALKRMQPCRRGRITNVSSISGRIGSLATAADYSSSKAGILRLTRTLARTYGPDNITVNAIAPGFIDTEMTRGFTHFDPDTVPLRRIGTLEDVADVILFLANDLSRYVTGPTIDINGGVFIST